jgi:WD40 repeat protein
MRPITKVVEKATAMESTLQFSPDGHRIVMVNQDFTARIWDATTGQELAILRGHEDQLYAVAFSPDGSMIATASRDQTARVWSASSGREVAVLRGHQGGVDRASFSADGTRLLTRAMDQTARLWSSGGGGEVVVLEGSGNHVNSAAFSHDGRCVVTATGDGLARIWDASTGQEIVVLRGHEASVNCAEFSPDNSFVVTASDDASSRIWRTSSGQQHALLRGHNARVVAASFNPAGSLAMTAGGSTARLWDTSRWEQVAVLRMPPLAANERGPLEDPPRVADWHFLDNDDVVFAAFSPNGARVLVLWRDSSVHVWDGRTAQHLGTINGFGRLRTRVRRGGKVMSYMQPLAQYKMHCCAAFKADATQIVVGAADAHARVWSVDTFAEKLVLRCT